MKEKNDLASIGGYLLIALMLWGLYQAYVAPRFINCPLGLEAINTLYFKEGESYDINSDGWVCRQWIRKVGNFNEYTVWDNFSDTTATPSVKLILDDDFNDSVCSWQEFSDINTESECIPDRYSFKVKTPGYTYVILPSKQESYTDFGLQVDVEQVGGPNYSLHGVAFRYKDNTHYYLFAIRGDGYYTILKNDDGFQYLVDWTKSEHINATGGNALILSAVGSRIRILINNEEMGTGIIDDSYLSGSIGLVVGTFPDEQGAPVIYFDNVKVWLLEK